MDFKEHIIPEFLQLLQLFYKNKLVCKLYRSDLTNRKLSADLSRAFCEKGVIIYISTIFGMFKIIQDYYM